jgi:hypothetical protein
MVSNECSDLVHDLFPIEVRDDSHSADYEIIAPFCHPAYDARGQWSNFVGPFSMSRRCINGRHVHDYVFDYARDFIARYDDQSLPWFLHLSLVEAHEGSLAVLAQVDASLASFLEWLLLSGAVRHPPVVLLLSDHGQHMGPFAEGTRGGKVEHKLPALFTIMPERIMRAHDHREWSPLTDAATPPAAVPSALPHEFAFPPSLDPARPLWSTGLSLTSNAWSLLTAREVYFFLRLLPMRRATVEESTGASAAGAKSQAALEREWQRTAQAHVEQLFQQQLKKGATLNASAGTVTPVPDEQQRSAVQQPQQAPQQPLPPSTLPSSISVDADLSLSRAMHRRAFHRLVAHVSTVFPSSQLRMDVESYVSYTPTSHAPFPPVRVAERTPLHLATPIPLSRTCELAGVPTTLCVCNREGATLE